MFFKSKDLQFLQLFTIILFQSIEFFKIVFNLSVQSVEQEGHYVIFICLHFIDELNQVMEGPCHLLYLLIKSTRLWNCHMAIFSSVLLISWTGLWQGLTSNLYVSVLFLSSHRLCKFFNEIKQIMGGPYATCIFVFLFIICTQL